MSLVPHVDDVLIYRFEDNTTPQWLIMRGDRQLLESNDEGEVMACQLARESNVRCFISREDGFQLVDCDRAPT